MTAYATTANDLAGIVERAAAIGEWRGDRAGAVAVRYLAFLDRCADAVTPLAPPDADTDLLWHVHMLHPRHYLHFCDDRYGMVIDHALPVQGARAEDWVASLATAGCNDRATCATAMAAAVEG